MGKVDPEVTNQHASPGVPHEPPRPEPSSQLDIERAELVKKVTLTGILAIATILIIVLILSAWGKLGTDISPVIALLTSGIGVIGTIIGSVVGHAQGATGRESEAKARAK